MHMMLVVLLLLLRLGGVRAFREINSSTDPLIGTHAVFQPYAAGFVGYYGDPANPSAERVNEGAPFSPDTPRIFFSAPLQQTCPGMVGPGRNGEYYCYSRDYGYCDRRTGLCVCNQGYTGLDCTSCLPSYFKQGGLCFAKKNCPNDCSRGGECDYATGVCTCESTRRGADCSQRFCAFDEKCVSCTSTVCLRCVEGFSVDPASQTCVSCARYDPRCLSCNSSSCLTCADLQLNSVRRSGVGLGPQIYTKQNYTYHVTVQDAYGNLRDSGGDLLVARIHGPDSSAGNITDLNNGDYIVTYRVMLPGAYEIETRVAEPQRGLTGYYYVDSRSVQRNLPSAVRTVDAVIDFDWSKNVTMRGYPRVVWRGFLRPLFTEEYTLWVKIQSDVGSAAGVYIDGQAVIDGLNTGATFGHVILVGGRLHAITVEYRSASLQQDPGYLSLLWQSVHQTAQLIPTQALISEASEILPRTQLAAVN
ncbi:uncharacterized protein IUM83_03290 [Phytophthora cinnamomi]|uniref:uncharacterized protein n=1 Tax=Phytophthora cinnamomi TaxID=4785 RepID=UPI00355983F3|nr:hypothetical protein IUM83_03290 [Phytophthora cinnamomi]